MLVFRNGHSVVSQLCRIGDMALLRRANPVSTRTINMARLTAGWEAQTLCVFVTFVAISTLCGKS